MPNKRKFLHSSSYYRDLSKYTENKWGSSSKFVPNKQNEKTTTDMQAPELPVATPGPNTLNERHLIQPSPASTALISSNSPTHQNSSLSSTDSSILVSTSKSDVREELREWAVNHQITHRAIDDLLLILKNCGVGNLPTNSRTLVQTARKCTIVDVTGGQYWHHGINKSLKNMLSTLKPTPLKISLNFNMDGLPLSRSSKWEFWPILCAAKEFPDIQPLIIGIYYGSSKPKILEEYLRTFVDELKEVLLLGITVDNSKNVSICINSFICDTPARCFVKGTVNFNHYHGCAKCTTIGEWDKKGRHMSFPRLNGPRRSDLSFRSRDDPDHHKEVSLLEELPINMVEDFPVADSLHLLDLGIMKKCLVGWTHGNFNFKTKWSGRDIDEISDWLESCNKTLPSEIHRAVRKLDCLKYWKGLEFRTFLLYLGVVVLKSYLPATAYQHFLLLFCAVTICTSKEYYKYTDLADQLLHDYVEKYIDIYGIDSITSNVHNLIHIVDDVKRFGPLPEISAYKFENRLGYIKRLLRTGNRPLSQISKRLSELSNIENKMKTQKKFPILLQKKKSRENSVHEEYHSLELCDGFILKSDDRNKWFLTKNNEIVVMLYATICDAQIFIYGQSLKRLNNLFELPIKSSYLNIYASTSERHSGQLYGIHEVKCKLISCAYNNQSAYIPLIHTINLVQKL